MSRAHAGPFTADRISTFDASGATVPPMFERLIYYMLAPDLFARIFLENGLNLAPHALLQPKLWVFYTFIMFEYAFQSLTLGRQRFRLNVNTGAFLLLLVMVTHGVMVALFWGNKPTKIFTDTVPVLVTAVNVALLNREGVFRGFNFERLSKIVFIFSSIMIFFGAAGLLAHRYTELSLGGSGSTPICLTIILIYLHKKERLTFLHMVWVALVVGPIVPTLNRTTLAVFSMAFILLVLPQILRSGRQVYFSTLFFVACIGAFVAFVPEDSPVMRRINGTIEHVSSGKQEETGSLYERQAEWIAINQQLAFLGPVGEYFGHGAGGTYLVMYSNGNMPDSNSNAHYSWSLFRLRYGNVGFVYLGMFFILILLSFWSNILKKDALSRIVAITDMWCIVFLFTCTVFNFLVAGLQFVDTNDASNRSP